MMRRCFVVLFFICFGTALFADIAPAEVKTDVGGSFRLRQEYWENITDLQTATANHADRDFFRLRTSLWGKADLNKDMGAYLRLTNEAKYYIGNYKPTFEANTSNHYNLDLDELIVDNLYFESKNTFSLPVDVRIGRQDFLGMYGEGFVLLDGTPGDGSRTFYFNAAKATWAVNKKNSVDLIYISNTKTDQYMPSLYPARETAGYEGNKRILNVSNEEGMVLYGRSKVNDNLLLEPYYIYKSEDPFGTNARLNLNTVGARAVVTAGNWKVRGEYAHQDGRYDSVRDRKADGGYLFVGQKFEQVAMKPEWELGVVYLSGDDSKTANTNEGWDPLFSRAPAWNELYIYTLTAETSKDGGAFPGYWTNLYLYKLGLKLAVDAATNLTMSYQYLRADQATSGLNAAMFSNSGKDRGHIGQMMLAHTFTKQIDGYLLAEYFIPGNFYVDNAQKGAFLRWQLQYKF
jgi:hypothetical protein